MVKSDDRPSLVGRLAPVRSDADPIHLSGQPVRLGFGTDTTHADDCFEVSLPDFAHAVVNAEPPLGIGVAWVGSFVDQRAHQTGPRVPYRKNRREEPPQIISR